MSEIAKVNKAGQINLIEFIESNKFDNVNSKSWHIFVWSNQFDQIIKKIDRALFYQINLMKTERKRKIATKTLFEQNYIIFFAVIRFSCRWISKKQFRSVLHLRYIIYVQRDPRNYLIGKFRSFRRKIHYQFYLTRNKTNKTRSKRYVCKDGPENLRKNFRVEELFSARNLTRYFTV